MKKIFLILVIFLSQFFITEEAFSRSVPVEEVFSDISVDYKYYKELQTLYERGMIFPDGSGKFNPKKLLNRDEFVGISMEVGCKRCISPNTDFEYIKAYLDTETFYDVPKKNQYFYCIAESDAKNYVKGYGVGASCQDGTSKTGERPFCVNNKITLEEALAVILRNSGIFTVEDNTRVIQKIYNGEITEKLSSDVGPKNSNGSAYTFYGYLKKALDFEHVEVDKNGNETVYKLLELENNKIRPHQLISKEDFVRIAYIALKANSCLETKQNSLAVKMDILQRGRPDTFNFISEASSTCEQGIDDEVGYTWKLYHIPSGTEVIKKQKNIENYFFELAGKRRVFLYVKDRCGKSGEAFSTIVVDEREVRQDEKNANEEDTSGLTVWIEADPIIGNKKLNINFEGMIKGDSKSYTYAWDFGDGSIGYGKNITHTFVEAGTYTTTLIVTDAEGNSGEATVVIKVLDFDSCTIDEDRDGIMDCDDICPIVPGDERNSGCPIFEKSCGSDCSCEYGYECSSADTKTCTESGVCLPKREVLNPCLEEAQTALIYGNAQCKTCPCDLRLDFRSTLRKCDLVFPAITSPHSSKIYSRGKVYRIR